MAGGKARAGRRLILLVLAAAVASAAGACSASAASGPASAARNVQVDQFDKSLSLARDHEGPALLVDTDDPKVLYLGETEMYSGECRFYVSTDQGASWRQASAPALLPFTANCAQGSAVSQNLRQELAQGPDGTIYNVFQANAADRNGSRSVLIGRSKDRGRSWETSVIDPGTVAPELGQQMEVNFEGHIALDPADPNRIYAMWRRSFNRFTPPKPTRPMMSTSTDGGKTWSAPVVMFEKNIGMDGPRPIVVGRTLYAFYRETPPSAPGPNDPPATEPPTTKLYVNTSTDGGKSWSKETEIARANDASEVYPVYDKARKQFYVVWHDNRDNELDVYFSKSKDGLSWSQPKLLNDDPRGARVGQYYPQISVAPNGRIDVAWYDWRDDPFPPPTVGAGQVLSLFTDRGRVASVYMTSSRDGGETWAKNTKVNDTPIDRTIGTWANNVDVMAPIAIASYNRGTIIAWSDTRNGNALNQTQDIYTSNVTFGKVTPRKVTGIQAGLAGGLFGLGLAMCLAVLLVRRGHKDTKPPATAEKTSEPVA